MISHRPVTNTNENVLYSTHAAIAPNTTVITPSSGVRNRLWRIHTDVPERTVGPSSGGGGVRFGAEVDDGVAHRSTVIVPPAPSVGWRC